MKKTKYVTYVIPGLMLAGCLVGYGVKSMLPESPILQAMGASYGAGSTISAEDIDVSYTAQTSDPTRASYTAQASDRTEGNRVSYAVQASDRTEGSGALDTAWASDSTQDDVVDKSAFQKQAKIYEPFGMTYDADKNELRYHGKLVRWFEDYYTIDPSEGSEGGIDFFNEKGVVDVYAVRNLDDIIRNADGSFDPSGRVIGLKEFSKEEFDNRDLDIIKNPPAVEAYAGEPMTSHEMLQLADEYTPFGVTYDADTDRWYFKGEKVRCFLDILTSNGESLNNGNFTGTMRRYEYDDGAVDIYTVRNFSKPNKDGNGSLTDIKKYSRKEFDAHTLENQPSENTGMQVQ